MKKGFGVSPLPKPAEPTVETGRKLPVLKINSLIKVETYFVIWIDIKLGKIINNKNTNILIQIILKGKK